MTTPNELRGVKVHHSLNELAEGKAHANLLLVGRDYIMTFKDSSVLEEEDDDALEITGESHVSAFKLRKLQEARGLMPHQILSDEVDEHGNLIRKVLPKYDAADELPKSA